MPVSVQSVWQRFVAFSAAAHKRFNDLILPRLKQGWHVLNERFAEFKDQAQPVLERAKIAWRLGLRILRDPGLAQTAARLINKPVVQQVPAAPISAPLHEAPPDSALVLLGLLQKEGRLIDFIQEDIQVYSDEEVGRGARVVHQGCRKVLAEYLTLVPVCDEPEGSRITLEPGFDASAIRPTGNLIGGPPFTGTLAHRGWRVLETRLPKIASGHDPHVIAAAEVEL